MCTALTGIRNQDTIPERISQQREDILYKTLILCFPPNKRMSLWFTTQSNLPLEFPEKPVLQHCKLILSIQFCNIWVKLASQGLRELLMILVWFKFAFIYHVLSERKGAGLMECTDRMLLGTSISILRVGFAHCQIAAEWQNAWSSVDLNHHWKPYILGLRIYWASLQDLYEFNIY